MDKAHAQGSGPAGALEPEWVPENEAIPFIRWSARVLGIIVAGFSLFMFIGETLAARQRDSQPMEPKAVIGLLLAVGYVIGMFLALKWERAGAILAGASLALLAIGLFISGRGSQGNAAVTALWGGILGTVYFLPLLLYMLCWWFEDRDRKRYGAAS